MNRINNQPFASKFCFDYNFLIILKHGGESILLTIIHGLLVASLTNLLFTFFCYVTNFW